MDDDIRDVPGASINYKYRMHDARIGRFFAVDPLTPKYPQWSPYQFAGNQVIHAVELEGLETSNNLNVNENFAGSGIGTNTGLDQGGSSGYQFPAAKPLSVGAKKTLGLYEIGVLPYPNSTFSSVNYENDSWTVKWSRSESWYGSATYGIANSFYLSTVQWNPYAYYRNGPAGYQYANLGGPLAGMAMVDRSEHGAMALSTFAPIPKLNIFSFVYKYLPSGVKNTYMGLQVGATFTFNTTVKSSLTSFSRVAGAEGFMSFTDDLFKLDPIPGYVDVLGHGNPNSMFVTVNGQMTPLSVGDLSNYLTRNGLSNYPIRLRSCNVGVTPLGGVSFAQRVANATGQRVIAPTGYLHTFSNGLHSIQLMPKALSNWAPSTGRWKGFTPE